MKITLNTLQIVTIYLFILLFSHFSLAADDSKKYESALFIADSHGTGKFGAEIDKYLRSISTETTSVASCGSSPSNWVNDSKSIKSTNCGYWKKDPSGKETHAKSHKLGSLEDELSSAKPNLTVVALGTNILSSPQNIEKEKVSIEKMIKEIKTANSRCIWIGPPDLMKNPFKANLESGVKEIKKVVEKNGCVFIDSTEITKYPKSNPDGIHYAGTAASDWGIDVAEKINQKLSTLPARKKARSRSSAVMQ